MVTFFKKVLLWVSQKIVQKTDFISLLMHALFAAKRHEGLGDHGRVRTQADLTSRKSMSVDYEMNRFIFVYYSRLILN